MFEIQIENKMLPTSSPHYSGQDCWIMYCEDNQFGLSNYNKWTVEQYYKYYEYNGGDFPISIN